jgi:hypothetical protein
VIKAGLWHLGVSSSLSRVFPVLIPIAKIGIIESMAIIPFP